MHLEAGNDDLDLILSNIEAGLRLLSFLQDRIGPEDQVAVGAGQAFVLEALLSESAAARDCYDRCRRKSLEARDAAT